MSEPQPHSNGNFVTTLRQQLRLSALQWLFLLSILGLGIAVFVFGPYGKYNNPELYDVLRTFAVGALSSAITIIIDRHLTTKTLATLTKEYVETAVGLERSLSKQGLSKAHENPFDFSLIFRTARKGETVWWLDTYCPRKDEFFDDLKKAFARGVNVRMLIIEPDCDNAKYRAEELEGTEDTGESWQSGLSDFIHKVDLIAERFKGNIEIRFYRDLPCIPMYLICKDSRPRLGWFSIYLGRATAHFTHFELKSSSLLSEMAKYYDAKWERNQEGLPASIENISSPA
jgi:hypothetical protein